MTTATASKMTFPALSDRYGLAPETAQYEPPRYIDQDGRENDVQWPLSVDGEVILDFGRKITGKVWLEADGPLEFLYATDYDQLALLHEMDPAARTNYDVHDVYIRTCPYGELKPNEDGLCAIPDEMSVFRLLRLKTEQAVTIRRCWIDFSAPHRELDGGFKSNDPELQKIWMMDAYTVLLCTQRNEHSLDGIPAPGSGYVLWDGPRRDRELWAGDLRPASLAWLSAYGDAEPIRNSLYMFWHARHLGCSESGMVPGSGSSHQIFYEWTFWYLVNAWEYYLWSGDKAYLNSLMAPGGLDETLRWVLRKSNDDGLVEGFNSWMYTLKVDGEMAGLSVVQVAGLEAMVNLFEAAGKDALAIQARETASHVRSVIPGKFFDPEVGALKLSSTNAKPRYPLCANAVAIIYGIGGEKVQKACYQAIKGEEYKTGNGLSNYWPVFTDEDGDWCHNPKTGWMHNGTVWTYPNCYAAWAHFHMGCIDEGLELLREFHRPHYEKGHTTLWEVMLPDGNTPIKEHGNLGSLCHAWGGLGAYLMHRYILGVEIAKPGFKCVNIKPQLGSLEYASGTVPTPHGPIELDLRNTGKGVEGTVKLPEGIEIGELVGDLKVLR